MAFIGALTKANEAKKVLDELEVAKINAKRAKEGLPPLELWVPPPCLLSFPTIYCIEIYTIVTPVPDLLLLYKLVLYFIFKMFGDIVNVKRSILNDFPRLFSSFFYYREGYCDCLFYPFRWLKAQVCPCVCIPGSLATPTACWKRMWFEGTYANKVTKSIIGV